MVAESFCAEDTFRLGEMLGKKLIPGAILCLDGELGVGKTVLVKGIAKGLEIDEPVSSPTFTILQEYHAGRLPLYHFDVYRIEDPEEMYELGYEDYFFGNGVCLIEWSSLIEELLPAGAIRIVIAKDLSRGISYRKITMNEGK